MTDPIAIAEMFTRWQSIYADMQHRLDRTTAALAAANARADAAEARVRQLEARPAVYICGSEADAETVRRMCTVLPTP